MYDLFEIAKEKGIEKGHKERTRQMLLETLYETIGFVPPAIIDSINKIDRQEVLYGLFKHAFKCNDLSQFQKTLDMALV